MNRNQTISKHSYPKKDSRKKKKHANSEIFTDRLGNRNTSERKVSPIISADKSISHRVSKIKEGFEQLENQLSCHPDNDTTPMTQSKKKHHPNTFFSPRTAKKYPYSGS
jgi:hypothetical protein